MEAWWEEWVEVVARVLAERWLNGRNGQRSPPQSADTDQVAERAEATGQDRRRTRGYDGQ
jgi:hypothetical protein